MARTGRPTDYTPDIGERILAHMESGLSLQAAAALEGIHRQRVYDWEKRHPDFADTISLARGLRMAKLEQDLLAAESSQMVTSRVYALKNASPEWRQADRHQHEISGRDGGPIETSDLTAQETARRVAYLLASAEHESPQQQQQQSECDENG